MAETLIPHHPADAYMYALIIPVLPFALLERVQIHEDEVQQWIGILLAAYGAGLLVGSRKFFFSFSIAPRIGPQMVYCC